ncbi:MAG TPA: HAD family phosphatase [Candidatus Saccharimonadales bacterium]|nr:HAD family phosphatase [Candidatus Saccharimonadales bacterium]
MLDPHPRPFAVFDIDGTLIRWQLYHAIADRLAKNGCLDAREFEKVRESRMSWKTRSGELSFNEYEDNLVRLVNGAIGSISVQSFEEACGQVIEEYKDQVYTYTRDLIEDLRQKEYLLFVISGSQAEIVQLLAEYYAFDDYAGTEYEKINGHFTGKNTPLRSSRKPTVLKEMVAKHGARWDDSIAVGDSESDIPMLEVVQLPVAFNPNKRLFKHAEKAGWKVVLERKNMVYELEQEHGIYRLK